MSVRKLTAKFAAKRASKMLSLAILMFSSVTVSAGEPNLPPADPFAFDPDFRWFEPIHEADMLDMKPEKRAHSGWYATYDLLYLYGRRPEQGLDTGDQYKLDPGKGERYDLGYMTPGKDKGWMFNYTNLSVEENDTFRIDRINRLNEQNLDGTPDFALGANRFGLPVFPEDGNIFGFSRRFYDIGISLNNVELDSFELNRTWRMEPYHYGGILEPMIGIRHVSMNDAAFARRYSRTREAVDLGLNPPPVLFATSTFYTDLGESGDAIEILNEELHQIENDVYSAQLGFRYFKFQNRFRYSAEFRAFTGVNLQCFKQNTRQTTTFYDGFDAGSTVDQNIVLENATTYERNDEFFLGYDIRGEISYQLTSMIHVRGGFQLIDLARGIWRNQRTVDNNNNNNNAILSAGLSDQGFLAVGGTFGIEVNR